MVNSALLSFMLVFVVLQSLAAAAFEISSQQRSEHLTNRLPSPMCGQAQILRIAKCACYLGTHVVTLSDEVHQACRKAFGHNFASEASGLCNSCKIFQRRARSSNVNAEMKFVYKASYQCLPSFDSKASYRSISTIAMAYQGLLRHRAARFPWIPLIVVALLVVSDTREQTIS